MEIVDLGLHDPAWNLALPVLQELRTELTAAQLDEVIVAGSPQGLRFTAVLSGQRCLAVAGWRIMATTSALLKLHVDDLVTSTDERSHGTGALLLAHLEARARVAGCRVLDLDSGVQRHAAHRFYLRERLDITAHHFAKPL
jgi:GNAT superfamily N-acetyltransferase